MSYTWLASRVLFPLHERAKGHHSVRLHRELEATQWLSPEEIAGRQLQRLREFLARAAADVPYYRDLMRAHAFEPAGLRSLADLERLPFLTADGTLRIPFDSPERYHWWKPPHDQRLRVKQILAEVKERMKHAATV